MNVYKEIALIVKEQHGFTVQHCWIAHVRADYGLTRRQAYNRINSDTRVKPCPDNKRQAIISAMRQLKMISDA